MKRLILLTVAAALSASFAWGALGDVVTSFPAPGRTPLALARANNSNYMWIYCNNANGTVHRINAETGVVQSSFNSPLGIALRGLSYSYGGGGGLPAGNYLWMGSTWEDHIYRCNIYTGSIYASFPSWADYGGGLDVKASADGGYLPTYIFVNNSVERKIYKRDLITGSCKAVFTTADYNSDLAWDWRNEIIWSGWAANIVRGYSTGGVIVATFSMPANYPRGFCYHGRYLWVTTLEGNRVWKIHCPEFVDNNANVIPGSMGRIKAVFR